MASGSLTGAQVVQEAQKFLGRPYVYGATGPSSFDCSGLVQYVYKQLGVTLPRTSEEQWAAGTPVKRSQLQPGDLVFSEMGKGGPGHVGIYAGTMSPPSTSLDLQAPIPVVIEAPHTGEDVKYLPLDQFGAVGFRRVSAVGRAGTVDVPGTGTAAGGLLSWPDSITSFFSGATDALTGAARWWTAFFQPSTYVRIGAGVGGALAVIAGLVFLLLAARET